jgi:hypothetical protein
MFLRAYLGQLQRATSEGVPVNGYVLWSSQDNFEWIYGYGDRFGITYVDFDTQQRIRKLSAKWSGRPQRATKSCDPATATTLLPGHRILPTDQRGVETCACRCV